jgi:hypothetical protein
MLTLALSALGLKQVKLLNDALSLIFKITNGSQNVFKKNFNRGSYSI